MTRNTINSGLQAYYESIWPDMRQALQYFQNLDHPQFMTVNDGYVSAPHKLMIVGMEPTNWGVEEYGRCFGAKSVADLMQVHMTFNNSEHKPELQKRGFWPVCYQLQSKINPGSGRFAFAYSNLVKLTESGKSRSSKVADVILKFPLLPKEIELSKPQIIVFFTGFTPFYTNALHQTFRELRNHRTTDLLYRLSHPTLPYNTFLTEHPRTLNNKGREATDEVLDAIATSVRQTHSA